MLAALIGISGVGKTEIINALVTNHNWCAMDIYTTREARVNETKICITIADFDKMQKENKLKFINSYYGHRYALSSDQIELSIKSTDRYIFDFGVEKIDQLDEYPEIKRIIVLPESEDYLVKQLRGADRFERIDEVVQQYTKYYMDLESLKKNSFNTTVLINKFNKIDLTIKEINIITKIKNRKERLIDILNLFKALPRAKTGLEAYKQLTESINSYEDSIWGSDFWEPPRSFSDMLTRTNRLYTIYPESIFSIESYEGVNILIGKKEIIFISRFGAVEVQEKLSNDKYNEYIAFCNRKEYVVFQKEDFWGGNVWDKKNQ